MAEPPAWAEAWQEALAKTVGRRVAHYRRKRRLTAGQLSTELQTVLGFDMKRAVIGNLETGLRRGVGIAEIFALAYVLGVPPILLVVPVGDDEQFEVLPTMKINPWYAARWVTGEGALAISTSKDRDEFELQEAYRTEVNFLGLYRRHDSEVERWLRVARMVESNVATAADAEGQSPAARLGEIEEGLRVLRWSIRELGAAPPPLRPAMQHLDETGGGEGGPTDA